MSQLQTLSLIQSPAGIFLDENNNIVFKLADAAGAKKISVQDSGGTEVAVIDSDGKFSKVASQYGEAYHNGNSTATVINAQNEVTPVSGMTTGAYEGTTITDKGGNITAFADGSGGTVTVTSAAHGLANGDVVKISGTTNYDGRYTVSSAATNTFKITATWVSDDATGTFKEGTKIKALTAGKYLAQFTATGVAASANKVVQFLLTKNGTSQNNTIKQVNMLTTDIAVAGSAVLDLAANDCVKLEVKNTTDAADITIKYANLSLTRL